MELLEAIDICHGGKTTTIEITQNGKVFTWTERAEKEYEKYKMARDFLVNSYEPLYRFLLWTKYI